MEFRRPTELGEDGSALNDAATPGANAAAPLLPCLKERKWIGRERTVCRALWESEASAYMPWLAIGYDHPHTFEFLDTSRLAEMNTTERALEAQALANLAQRPAAWKGIDVDVQDGKGLHILLCTDDFFAAERIIDRDFMRQAQRMLKARRLLVGVPRRGLLMAIDGELDQQAVTAFGVAVAGQFSRGESAVISPMLFALKDGAIVGIVEGVAEALVPDGEPNACEEEAEDEPRAPYVTAVVSRNDRGTEDVHLLAAGEDGARLTMSIESAFMHLMKEHAARKEFSGHIQIVVLGRTPPAARKHIPSVLEHLCGVCSEISTGERRYRVTLTYQQDSLEAEAANGAGGAAAEAAPQKRARASGRSPWRTIPLAVGILLALIALSRFLT